MMIRPTTNYRLPITNYHGAFGTISTTVERALQIHPFLTNKANFQKVKLSVKRYNTADYAKRTLGESGKNKANSKPIQTQYKANSNPIQTQNEPKANPNEPNSNPIQTQTEPIRPNFERGRLLINQWQNHSNIPMISKNGSN